MGEITLSRPTQTRLRTRKTVEFDAARFEALLEKAIAAELARVAEDLPGRWTEVPHRPDVQRSATGAQMVREHMLSLLKSFCDAARPAGGLALDEFGDVADLPGLLASGRAQAREGSSAPKLLDKVRRGKPVDLRIGVAALHFFRVVLAQPRLGLQDIGGVESERLRTVRRLERAIGVVEHDLPRTVYEALRARAEETAAYATLAAEAHVHYAFGRVDVDALGVRRLHLLRTTRWRPLRLQAFPTQLAPAKVYECSQWNQVRHWRLRVGQTRPGEPLHEIPLVKRLLPEQGVFRIEPSPDLDPALRRLLVVGGADVDAQAPVIEWLEEVIFNLADRDILVWYAPVHGLSVTMDEALSCQVQVSVGDSPGLQRTPEGWRLDRSLMPREVLAVRFLWRGLDLSRIDAIGSGGEWLAQA